MPISTTYIGSEKMLSGLENSAQGTLSPAESRASAVDKVYDLVIMVGD